MILQLKDLVENVKIGASMHVTIVDAYNCDTYKSERDKILHVSQSCFLDIVDIPDKYLEWQVMSIHEDLGSIEIAIAQVV